MRGACFTSRLHMHVHASDCSSSVACSWTSWIDAKSCVHTPIRCTLSLSLFVPLFLVSLFCPHSRCFQHTACFHPLSLLSSALSSLPPSLPLIATLLSHSSLLNLAPSSPLVPCILSSTFLLNHAPSLPPSLSQNLNLSSCVCSQARDSHRTGRNGEIALLLKAFRSGLIAKKHEMMAGSSLSQQGNDDEMITLSKRERRRNHNVHHKRMMTGSSC